MRTFGFVRQFIGGRARISLSDADERFRDKGVRGVGEQVHVWASSRDGGGVSLGIGRGRELPCHPHNAFETLLNQIQHSF